MSAELSGESGPLNTRTWSIDRHEGQTVQTLKDSSAEPMREPLIEVPDDEFASMACNVLALAPDKCVALDGNPITRSRLEKAGIEVLVYDGTEISRKGEGGPTCLTRPLAREQ